MKQLCSTTQIGISFVLTLVILVTQQLSYAQVRTSNSYQIQSDSVNFGGGFSSSTNYSQESTFGEVGTGESSSSNYKLKAGYQQMTSSFISLSNVDSVTMSPTIPGLGGGTSTGSTSVVVITDNSGGYSLTIEAETSPAMQKGADTIADYTPAGDPDFTFTTGALQAFFGYTPEGPDIVTRFQDSVGSCNQTGSDTALACWDGLSTTAVEIASANNPNQPLGATTTIEFRIEVDSAVVLPPGVYTATTTLTAITL